MRAMFVAWFKANKGSRFWRTSQQIEERYARAMVKARDRVAELDLKVKE